MLKRTLISAALLIAMLFSLTSCSDKVFSHAEFCITLPSGFSEEESESYDLVMRDGEVSVAVLRISLYAASESGIPDNLSPFAFAEYTSEDRGRAGEIFTYRDIPYFSDYTELSGRKFYTLYTFYRSKNAYFIVLFSSLRSAESEMREKFFEYADTVSFTD